MYSLRGLLSKVSATGPTALTSFAGHNHKSVINKPHATPGRLAKHGLTGKKPASEYFDIYFQTRRNS